MVLPWVEKDWVEKDTEEVWLDLFPYQRRPNGLKDEIYNYYRLFVKHQIDEHRFAKKKII
jgi:hypothetical protein